MNDAAILEGLAKSKLAVELNDDERRILAGAMTLRDLKHGEVLVQEASADDHLYVVVSGVLGVVKGAGMGEESTLWLLDQGVKVVGIDAWSWDRPLPFLKKEFNETKDATILWAAHFAGIKKEYLHIEKMANLNKLPPSGFTLVCFPVKIRAVM